MTSLTYERVVEIAGPLSDAQIARILECDAEEQDLVAAVVWLNADDAIGQERQQQAGGKIGQLCEILVAEEAEDDEEKAGRPPA